MKSKYLIGTFSLNCCPNVTEIISKNLNFSKKADIYFRLRRLIDENQMGSLFKVMLIKNKENKFKLGF